MSKNITNILGGASETIFTREGTRGDRKTVKAFRGDRKEEQPKSAIYCEILRKDSQADGRWLMGE